MVLRMMLVIIPPINSLIIAVTTIMNMTMIIMIIMMNDLNDHDNDDNDNRQNPTHFFILTIQPKSFPPCQLLVYSVRSKVKKAIGSSTSLLILK